MIHGHVLPRNPLRYALEKLCAATLILMLFTPLFLAAFAPMTAHADVESPDIQFSWPTQGERDSSKHVFRGAVEGLDTKEYYLFWAVDGGRYNKFDYVDDEPYKQVELDFGKWHWRGDGSYTISLIVQDRSAREISRRSFRVWRDRSDGTAKMTSDQDFSVDVAWMQEAARELPDAENVPEPQDPTTEPVEEEPVTEEQEPDVEEEPVTDSVQHNESRLYRNAESQAQRAFESFSGSDSDRKRLEALASQPTGIWLGSWYGDIESTTRNFTNAAAAADEVPVFVLYNIPNRDCGQHSAGGLSSAGAYRDWVSDVASGIGGNDAIVVLEPDAITLTSCLSEGGKEERFSLLRDAVSTLKRNSGTSVYLDTGHANWLAAGSAASLLKRAGVTAADGFALNTSNFVATGESVAYGTDISNRIDGKTRFVIDTSRNGNGSNWQWCNPDGRALGETPTLSTGIDRVDAFLWTKAPGESDGWCNGGPAAGAFWLDYAIDLARNAGY